MLANTKLSEEKKERQTNMCKCKLKKLFSSKADIAHVTCNDASISEQTF